MKKVYKAYDGTVFESEAFCECYEFQIDNIVKALIEIKRAMMAADELSQYKSNYKKEITFYPMGIIEALQKMKEAEKE